DEMAASLTAAGITATTAVSQFVAGLARFAHGYLRFLPASGNLGLTTRLFNILVDSMEELPETQNLEKAKGTVLRFLEGSAGASRYWWDMLAGPVADMNLATGTSNFEFTDAYAETDPTTTGVRAHFGVTSDWDCDGLADHADLCPLYCTPATSLTDSDGDLLGDVCDVCRYMPRGDYGLPRLSQEYYPPDEPARVRGHDRDGDRIYNWCDLCPDSAASRETDEADIPPHGSRAARHGVDMDRDGIGDRCDNCPEHPNRDQRNCNEADERAQPGVQPAGDACDRTPCVDMCIDPQITVTTYQRDAVFGTEQPVLANFCAVGGIDLTNPADYTVGGSTILSRPFDTDVRGCKCTDAEYRGTRDVPADCTTNLLKCPAGGIESPRWGRISYPGRPADGRECVGCPTYDYRPLYWAGTPSGFGLRGRIGDLRGYYAFWNGEDISGDERWDRQAWNWIDDLCAGRAEDPSCNYWTQMWFRPFKNSAVSWFAGGFALPIYGNTYTQPWLHLYGEQRMRLPGEAGYPVPSDGTASMTTQWVIGEAGRMTPSRSALADLLEKALCMVALDCRWPYWMFFDPRGDLVAGMLISKWDAARNTLGWTVGTKVVAASKTIGTGEEPPLELFDLWSPSIAFAFDGNGDPNRYWLFGGLDASGLFSDQMWGARRTYRPDDATKQYADVAFEDGGSPVAAPNVIDPTTTYFELARIRPGEPWPSARVGATLTCTGSGVVDGAACDNLCPKVAVALGQTTPPDGLIKAAGRLILVGGRGAGGLLGDVWLYDETATATRPTTAAEFEIGPWPGGWRLAGNLPDIAGGLTDAGSAQVMGSLWLVGGRTDAGPTADLFRIDVQTGAARKVIPLGAVAPAARISPAVAYDVTADRLLAFGQGIRPAEILVEDR
ncbi:MAG: thrombospondin type 3 repeat-containing protein, partial [Myxococcota bacterium]|nr:thrombospondin type 3 repeat-containing protein [Myxococcota bacterium]